MNFDDIISSNKQEQNNYSKPFNKEEWQQKKQAERQELYDLADKTAEEVKTNPVKFKQYLDTQAIFNVYSVNNALLISAQMPNATQIKEYDDWRKAGAFVRKNPTFIKILEPSESYNKEDGTTRTFYNPKRMLDISQTNAKPRENTRNHTDRDLVTAFLYECPVDVKIVDELPDGKGAEWNKEDNVLYIRRGLESSTIFNVVSVELAKVGLEESGNQELDNFKSYCASYLICKKHDIDVSSYNFDNLPESLKDMESSEVKNMLGDIRGAMEDMNSRMNTCFEKMAKEQKNKAYER